MILQEIKKFNIQIKRGESFDRQYLRSKEFLTNAKTQLTNALNQIINIENEVNISREVSYLNT